MRLSVIVPVYNEKNTISQILERIEAVPVDKEIIVVDDCSDDGTRQILTDKFKSRNGFLLIMLDKNRGKGAAIREALPRVGGEVIIIQDADLEYEPKDYLKVIGPIMDSRASVVYGSRFAGLNMPRYCIQWFRSKLLRKDCDIGHIYLSNLLCIKLLNLLVRVLYGAKITDEATCYKAFKADVLRSINLKCEKFEFCPEVTAKILKKGYKICEVPISYTPRSTEHGKKIGWRDGLMAILTLIKYRFTN